MVAATEVTTKAGVEQATQSAEVAHWPNGVPPLENGDRLSRAEFERRYERHPEIKRAELIEGMVYVSSPVHYGHGSIHIYVATWLGTYTATTRVLKAADNTSLRLDQDNYVQPDLCAWMPGARIRLVPSSDEGSILEGVPDLVVEVAASSASYDLHHKMNVYRRNGVREYLVLLIYEREARWFVWQEGEYRQLVPDEQGILRSAAFPGLWLDTTRFWSEDQLGVLETLRQGMETEEFRAFVQRLRGEGRNE
jgi:Uma2 family endonuclease